MTVAVACAICGAPDRIGVGVCVSCAVVDRDWALLFVRRGGEGDRVGVTSALRDWLVDQRDDAAIEEAAKGHRVLAVVPDFLGQRAAAAFEADGVPTRVLTAQQWHKALPPHFVLMLVAIVMVGGLAGVRASSFMLWATPMLVTLLLVGAWLHMRTPLIRFARSQPALPASARKSLATALAGLPAGRPRDLLTDLASVAENTYAGLPEAFRHAGIGAAIVAFVTEAGPLAVETVRLKAVAGEVDESGAAITRAVEQRVQLLEQAIEVLGRIARQGAESSDSTAAEVDQLLGRVRAEQLWLADAEAVVRNL